MSNTNPTNASPASSNKSGRRRIGFWIAGIVAILAIGGALWSMFGVHEISMTQADIQKKIDEKMPYESKNGVKVDNVKLDLSDNKLGLSVDAKATKFKTEYQLSAKTKGELRYDRNRGAFYFHPEQLHLSDVRANGTNVSEKVGKFIDKWVDSKKILDNKAELMAAAEDLVQSLVQSSAEAALTRVPVYKLQDNFKGYVVRAALERIEVRDGMVIAHVSLWQLTWTVLGWLLLLLLAIGFVILLFVCPEAVLAILCLGSNN